MCFVACMMRAILTDLFWCLLKKNDIEHLRDWWPRYAKLSVAYLHDEGWWRVRCHRTPCVQQSLRTIEAFVWENAFGLQLHPWKITSRVASKSMLVHVCMEMVIRIHGIFLTIRGRYIVTCSGRFDFQILQNWAIPGSGVKCQSCFVRYLSFIWSPIWACWW